jgi:2-oxoglutarate ferredoxin oxidoreductase subunit beta
VRTDWVSTASSGADSDSRSFNGVSFDPADVVSHDATNLEPAFALSLLSDQDLHHTVPGIFRDVERTTYDDAARAQVQQAHDEDPNPDLQAMLTDRDIWTIAG